MCSFVVITIPGKRCFRIYARTYPISQLMTVFSNTNTAFSPEILNMNIHSLVCAEPHVCNRFPATELILSLHRKALESTNVEDYSTLPRLFHKI